MRRLLASVALLVTVLAAPSTALATVAPTITAPAPVSSTPDGNVTLVWSSVGALVTYRVFRLVAPVSGGCPAAAPGAATQVMPDTVDVYTYMDTLTAQEQYCYWVEAQDLITPAADSTPVVVTFDTVAPGVPVVTQTGGDGCSIWTVQSALATDNVGRLSYAANGVALPYQVLGSGAPYEAVTVTVSATDAGGNTTSALPIPGHTLDPTRPPAPNLEVTTDPSQQQATLSWDNTALDDGAPILQYRLRQKGPQGIVTNLVAHSISSVAVQNLQLDATYEFTLDATDVCGFGSTSVALVRLNDKTPPSLPLVANPAFDSNSHVVRLSWIPSTDDIQIDHYEILRNGIPLGATDASVFTDSAPFQHADISYVVRAVDTNGNEADSAPVTITTPDWTPPTAPILTVDVEGTTATLHWPAAKDNVGVVGYAVLRDDKVKATMTAALRTFKDLNVPPGLHTWRVRALDDAGLSADSAPQTRTIVKPLSRVTVVSLKMLGSQRGGAARYSLAGPARLLLDLRVIGTVPKPQLRLYVESGNGRITVWRGIPGTSATRELLNSAVARHGSVTINLGRTLHAGHIRLVLVASKRMVIVGTGKRKPSMSAG